MMKNSINSKVTIVSYVNAEEVSHLLSDIRDLLMLASYQNNTYETQKILRLINMCTIRIEETIQQESNPTFSQN